MPIAKILKGQNVPIKIWTTNIEEEAEKQLYNMATLPFLYKHIAVMGDVHWGNGACVGSVIATKNAIIPATCGVDIGCGMMAVKLDINKDIVLDKLKELRHSIERSIPVGFNSNKELSTSVDQWFHNMGGFNSPFLRTDNLVFNDKVVISKSKYQMGTLGGGNHFIEICLDTNGAVWVMLHSGSRNIGKTIADIYIEKAKVLMDKYFIKLADPNLAYLAKETQEFDNYINDLHWCQDYAMANRQEMMSRVLKDMAYMFNDKQPINKLIEVNCHHNYTEIENHYGENVYITSKGAVRARLGDFGIIPGIWAQDHILSKEKEIGSLLTAALMVLVVVCPEKRLISYLLLRMSKTKPKV